MIEQMDRLNPVLAIAPKATTTDTTALVSGIINLAEYEGCTFAIAIGALAGSGAAYAVTLEEGNAANLSDTAAATAFVGTGLAGASFVLAQANSTTKLGYIGQKQYVRLTITPNGSNTGAFVSAICIKGLPNAAPTPNPPA